MQKNEKGIFTTEEVKQEADGSWTGMVLIKNCHSMEEAGNVATFVHTLFADYMKQQGFKPSEEALIDTPIIKTH